MRIDRSTSLLLISFMLTGCGADSQPENPDTADGLPVRVTEVREQAPPARLRLPGETRAVERMQPAFLHAGYLAERLVARGDSVRAGDTLAILHNPALAPAVAAGEARVRELDARLQQAEKELARIGDLHRRDVASEDDLDRARAQRDAAAETRQQAEAELDNARRQFADANLRAPADGIVAELLAEPGDFVAAGQPILTLQSNGVLEVAVLLPERAASRLKPGDPAEAVAWQSGTTVHGSLREIGQAAGGKPAPAVIELNPGSTNGWLPGQAVHVHLEWPEPESLLVPLGALGDPGTGQARVFRVHGDHAEAMPVDTGRLHDGWVAVQVSGPGELEPGDQVVTAGQARLLDGEKVRVLP